MSKDDADEAVSVVSLTSSSGGYINGRNSIKTIGRKEKNVFRIFANTKIIDFNHTYKIKHA
jgi:hypothetical protein